MAGSVNNLKYFDLLNDKNKIAGYKDYRYLATSVRNREFNRFSGAPFFQFNRNFIELDGVEPILSVLDLNNNIVNQYNFRVDKRNDVIDGTTNIQVYTPRPESFDDTLDISYGVPVSPRGITTIRRPHISDIQILSFGGYLHIFLLCDVFYAYAPNDEIQNHLKSTSVSFNKIQDPHGHYARIVVYQQHEFSASGDSISTTPTRKTVFPMQFEPNKYQKLRYGTYTSQLVKIDSLNLQVLKFIYHPVGGVVDFHCGSIDNDTIYCLLSLNNGTIDLYAINYTSFTDDTDYLWGYREKSENFFQKKFNPIGTDGPSFNIYSQYINSSKFYISYSTYNKSKEVVYKKILTELDFTHSWKFKRIVNSGKGLLSFIGKSDLNDHINFIYRTDISKLQRFKGNVHIGDDLEAFVDINDEILNWKYKLYPNRKPKTGFFKYTRTSLTEMFGRRQLIPKPLGKSFLISVQEYNNVDISSDTYLYYANFNNIPYRAESFYVGSDVINVPFERFNSNINLQSNGSYYIKWLP